MTGWGENLINCGEESLTDVCCLKAKSCKLYLAKPGAFQEISNRFLLLNPEFTASKYKTSYLGQKSLKWKLKMLWKQHQSMLRHAPCNHCLFIAQVLICTSNSKPTMLYGWAFATASHPSTHTVPVCSDSNFLPLKAAWAFSNCNTLPSTPCWLSQ